MKSQTHQSVFNNRALRKQNKKLSSDDDDDDELLIIYVKKIEKINCFKEEDKRHNGLYGRKRGRKKIVAGWRNAGRQKEAREENDEPMKLVCQDRN